MIRLVDLKNLYFSGLQWVNMIRFIQLRTLADEAITKPALPPRELDEWGLR